MAKKILYNEDAQKALQNGVYTVAECVKVTLGAKGNFVGLDRDYGSPLITNDGVTIAKEVVLSDEFEKGRKATLAPITSIDCKQSFIRSR